MKNFLSCLLLIAAALGMTSVAIANQKANQFDISDVQLQTGKNCLSAVRDASFMQVKPECQVPLKTAANHILSVMRAPENRIDRIECDIKNEFKYDDLICRFVVFGNQDSKGCGYQQADFEVLIYGEPLIPKLVAKTKFQFFCDTTDHEYIYHGLK